MDSPLVFDVMHEVSVPSGISEQGQTEIVDLLSRYRVTFPSDWDWAWNTTKGNLTKRIEKLAKENKTTIPEALTATIGEVAQEHSLDPVTYRFKITHNLNWNAGDFGDHGSCFWGGRTSNRELLIHHNAYAVQFFNAENQGLGRCFGYELEPPMQVLFNAYGRLSGKPIRPDVDVSRSDISLVKVARVFALHLKLGSYRKITLLNNGRAEGDLYVNSNNGYIIGSWGVIRRIASIDLHLEDPHTVPCGLCGTLVEDEHKLIVIDEELRICPNCFKRRFFHCAACGTASSVNESKQFDGRASCAKCYKEKARDCSACGTPYSIPKMYFRPSDKKWMCRDCFYRNTTTCPTCHQMVDVNRITRDGGGICLTCSEKKLEDNAAPKESRVTISP